MSWFCRDFTSGQIDFVWWRAIYSGKLRESCSRSHPGPHRAMRRLKCVSIQVSPVITGGLGRESMCVRQAPYQATTCQTPGFGPSRMPAETLKVNQTDKFGWTWENMLEMCIVIDVPYSAFWRNPLHTPAPVKTARSPKPCHLEY